jgi:N-acyl-D-aspartate/D-glutamate deacylase
MVADLNVFDPETVAPLLPTVARDLPGGGTRLVQRAQGFKATIVNGQVLLAEGEETGERPGQLLRGPFRSVL